MTKKKRNIIIAAVVVCAFGAAFSGGNKSASETTETTVEASDHSFLLDYDLLIADVKNGTGDTVIGKRAYITIPSAKLNDITGNDLAEFAETNVNDSYNWVSIMTDSGEGICFAGGSQLIATHGKLDDEGAVVETLGGWIKGDNGYTYQKN